MNRVSKKISIIMMFLVILFANISFATQEEAADAFEDILHNITVGTITITREDHNIAGSSTMPVPTVVISKKMIEENIPSGWSYEYSAKTGALTLKDKDGNKYSQTLYIKNKSGYTIPPDTAVGQLQAFENMYVNTTGIESLLNGNGIKNKVEEMYKDETGESLDGDYFCLTYGTFEINQRDDQSTPMGDKSAIYQNGSQTTFAFNYSDNYDVTQMTLNGEGMATVVFSTYVGDDGKSHVIPTDQLPNGAPQISTIDLESGETTKIIITASDNTAGRIYFNVAQPREYYLRLYDSSGDAVVMNQTMLLRSVGNSEEHVTCYLVNGALQATLNANDQYYIETPEKNKEYYLEILAGTASVTGEPPAAIDDPSSGETLFEKIEKLVSQLIMGISKVLNYLLSNALGKTITLDDIIFNSYSETKLDFFKYDLDGKEVTSESETVNALKDSISTWYANFKAIALVGYMAILVYIGIKFLMISTTPDAKAKCKQTFTTWVMGIIILMFFPYVMKYIIILNDAVVKYIDEVREYKDKTTASIDSSVDEGFIYTNFNDVIDFDTGNDYMSVVGKLASDYEKLGFALTYLILSWQLVMMVVYYYKRLFITAFLIIIFPMVALMYVWDKLNDGRSQSLSMWLREFSMAVFVQSFHAIVYVFVVSVIYSTTSADSYDFILLMIASSFLFAGENILKSIFGGGGEALGSAAQTAGKITLITNTITQVGTRTISNLVSKDGFVRQGIRSHAEWKKWRLLDKKGPDGKKNIEILATNEAAQLRINKLLPAEGEVTPTIRKTAEVVDTFNNLDKKTPEEIAKAKEEYDRLMKKRKDGSMTPEERRQFDAIMSHSKINMNQIDRLDRAMTNAAIAYSLAGNSNKTKKTIMQNLQVEVEVIINSVDPNSVSKNNVSKSTNNVIQAGIIGLKRKGINGIKREDVRNATREKLQKSGRVYNNIQFSSGGGSTGGSAGGTGTGTSGTSSSSGTGTRAGASTGTAGRSGSSAGTSGGTVDKNARAQSIAEQYKASINKNKLDTHTEQMIDSFSHKLANFEDVGTREIDVDVAYDMVSTLPTNAEEKEMFDKMAKLANLQDEIESLAYLMSKKAMTDVNVAPNMQRKFESVARSMETQALHFNAPAYTVDVDISSKRNDVSVDPYVSIMEIVNTSSSNGADINDFNDIINTASSSSVVEQIVDSKMDEIRSGNQSRSLDSQDFAEVASKYFNILSKNYDYEEATYMGYTASDVKKMKHAAYGDFVTNAAGLAADAVTLPAGAVFGAAVGAAFTSDGMPLGEMMGGVAAGTKAASTVADKIIPDLTSAEARAKTKNGILEKVKNRVESDENNALNARNLFENAQYASRGQADTYLTLDGFTANLIVDANNDLTAIIHVRAENAEYVCVNEQPGAGAWQSFQENISYTFRDNDYNKTHSLYVYVKDAAGNVKNSVQYNLRA